MRACILACVFDYKDLMVYFFRMIFLTMLFGSLMLNSKLLGTKTVITQSLCQVLKSGPCVHIAISSASGFTQ